MFCAMFFCTASVCDNLFPQSPIHTETDDSFRDCSIDPAPLSFVRNDCMNGLSNNSFGTLVYRQRKYYVFLFSTVSF